MDKKYFSCSGLAWYWHLLIFTGFVAATFLLYVGDLELGFFHLDDPSFVVNNPWITQISCKNLWRIIEKPYFANYSPSHIYSYFVDYAVAGLDPRIFHFSNNIWAGLTTGFVYLLAFTLTGNLGIAIAAGVLFAVHPVHVEVVTWITNRKDLVAVTFALPSIMAWSRYRRDKKNNKKWYAISLLLFLFAVTGKLSVVVLPGILFLFDYFYENRRGLGIILDKLPFVPIGLFCAFQTGHAQPLTRHSLDFLGQGYQFLENMWLLTGFGSYVIYRPNTALPFYQYLLGFISVIVLVESFLLRKKIPGLALVFCYWIVLALVPSQILSFVHPVTDRYLFFPSVAFVILISWGIVKISHRLGSYGKITAILVLSLIAVIWLFKSQSYLNEWKDPRSVWYGASKKSNDTNVFLYLGTHYQNMADAFDTKADDKEFDRERLIDLAKIEWQEDERLNLLLEKWKQDNYTGEMTKAFQQHLRDYAWTQFERAVSVKRKRVLPNLFFRRGKIQFDRGNLDSARIEFQKTCEEAEKHTYVKTRQEMSVRCHYALGIVAWHLKDYEEAMKMLKIAQEKQLQAGETWEPLLEYNIKKLQRIMNK